MSAGWNYEVEIILFKDDLKHIHLLEGKVKRLKAEIDAIQYELENVKAIDLTNEKVKSVYTNPLIRKEHLIDKRDRLTSQQNYLEDRIERVYIILDNLPSKDRQAIIDIYVNNRTYAEVSQEHFYSIKGMQKHINRMLKSTMEELHIHDNMVV